MNQIFTRIYETGRWGNNRDKLYKGSSGPGSSLEANKDTYIPFLKTFITDNGISSVADLGCGDGRCISSIYDDLSVDYHGYDAYAKVITSNRKKYPQYRFTHLDICASKRQIESADLCVLKDVLQHWSLQEIIEFMDYIVACKKFRFVLICNCSHQTKDDPNIQTGNWRPLSCDYSPLNKYNAIKQLVFGTKEVSVISLVN